MKLLKCLYKQYIRVATAVGLLMGSFALSLSAFAAPVLDNVAAGQATVTQVTNTTVINQASQKAVLNWRSFNIGQQESTHFQQPTGGMALNRISASQGASQIYGKLTATGRIILLNPAGIHFGPSAYVNVGGLIATTANITDQDFMNGHYVFNAVSPNDGEIINEGQLIAEDHGLIALMGNGVSNDGTIQANLGTVVLSTGESYTMSFDGNDMIGFSVSGAAQKGIKNSGTIRADGGTVRMQARVAAGVLDNVINNTGVIEARSVGTKTGDIIIDGGDMSDGIIYLSGKIHATGRTQHQNGQKGGQVLISGGKILVDSTADIDVSGTHGGGNVFIGGNLRGQGPLPNAKAVVVAKNASIKADAIESGNGGTVIVYSEGATQVYGNISARGGAEAGDGGLIETSGKYLDVYQANINTSAPHGQYGTWLLDPVDITISTDSTSANIFTSGGNPTVYSPFFSFSTLNNINNSDLSSTLNSTNVIVITTPSIGTGGGAGDITVNAPITWSAFTSLTLVAEANIIINALINAANGSLLLSAGSSSNSITTGSSGVINVQNFNLVRGSWIQIAATLPAFTVTNYFQINSDVTPNNNAVFVRALSGDGSVDSPFVLADIYGLQAINSNPITLGINYVLNNNIDASVTASWRDGAGFVPIGNNVDPFTGSLNGQHYTVSNLYINQPSGLNVGLFGYVDGAAINQLGVNGNITGQTSTGILAGFVNNSTIAEVYTSGSVTASGIGDVIGGLIGQALLGSISQAYNTASVTVSDNSQHIGGLVGFNTATITDAYNTGSITTGDTPFNVGGIAGYSSGTLSKTFTTGEMIIGLNPLNLGGLVGSNDGAIDNSYWNLSTSNILNPAQGCGNLANCGATGLSTNAMYNATNYPNFSFYDPTNNPTGIWYMAGYPHLTMENTSSITNVVQLQLMNVNLSANYTLANDIDASDTQFWNDGAGFNPIGNLTTGIAYLGNFDGQMNHINNLYINRPSEDGIGLFGYKTGGAISNVHVDGNITGASVTGLLAGAVQGVTLSNISSSGNVNSPNTNTIYIGGLLGYASTSNLTYAYNSANVTASDLANFVGGLIGRATISTMQDVYSTGNVTTGEAASLVGGLVGYIDNGIIDNSYASGLITTGIGSSSNVGGLVGATVTSTIADSFWDTTTSGINDMSQGCGNVANCSGVTGAATSTLLTMANYSGATWNIGTDPTTNTWVIFDGSTRPMLSMEYDTTIRTGHQLQLMGLNSTTRSTAYEIANDIDLSGTTNAADVWGTSLINGGAGFIPIGDTSVAFTSYFTGTLDGNNHTIENLYINSSGTNGVGLFGVSALNSSSPAIKDMTVSGTVISNVAGNVGILAGLNLTGSQIDNVVTRGSVTGPNYLGGITGQNTGTISNSANYATVTANGISQSYIGGLVGSNGAAVVDSFNAGDINVPGTASYVGGVIGNSNGGTIARVYNSGHITVGDSTDSVGGVIGFLSHIATILENAYNVGTITANNGTNIGGLAGFNLGSIITAYNSGRIDATGTNIGGFVGNNAGFLDSGFWDNQTSNQATGIGTGGGIVSGVSTASMLTGATFAGFNITSVYSPNATPPAFTWYIFENNTRPMLMMEHETTITNAHQLQLAGTTLGANYTLGSDIDLTNAMNNTSDVWATNQGTSTGLGFYPIASGALYAGTFDGAGYGISNLYINREGSSNAVGLFGITDYPSVIRNLQVTGTVIGGNITGGLVGQSNGNIMSVYSGVDVSGYSSIGGLVGQQTGGIIGNAYTDGTVTMLLDSQSQLGGLVGASSDSTLTQIINSYSTSHLIATTDSIEIGGLVGRFDAKSIINSYSTANIEGGTSAIGGLAGYASGTISNTYAAGLINAEPGAFDKGGLVGVNTATVDNSFWDIGTTGESVGVGLGSADGITGGNYFGATPDLSQAATFTGWNFTNTWNIVEGQSYPYLQVFYTDTPRIISGISTPDNTVTASLAINGEVRETIVRGANGLFYFLTGQNVIAKTENLIADNTPFLIFFNNAPNIGNRIAVTPTSGGSLTNGVVDVSPFTLTVGASTGSSSFNNAALSDLKGGLSDLGIVFDVDLSNHLSLNDGISFTTPVNTTYSLDGNMTATNGDITLNGPIIIDSAYPALTTTTTGDIHLAGDINAAAQGNSLDINTVGVSSSISGSLNGLDTALKKRGTGTLTLSNANTHSGATLVDAGVLRVTNNAAFGASTSVDVASGATLELISVAISTPIPLNLNGSGATADGTLISTGTSSYTGSVLFNTPDVKINTIGGLLHLTGQLSGVNLNKYGAGNLMLGENSNNYTGTTNINEGTLSLSTHNVIPNDSAVTVAAGATFDLDVYSDTIGSLAGAGNVSVLFDTLTTGGNNTDTTFSGIISGGGHLIKNGTGRFTLSGDNTYAGTTLINNGTLQVGDGGATGQMGGDTITNNAWLIFMRSNDYTLNQQITGSGNVTQDGVATLTFFNDNTYTGTTFVNYGTLKLGVGTSTGSVGTGDIVVNSALIFDRSNTYSVNNFISGSGYVAQSGTGTVELNHMANTYTGKTFINSGTLLVTKLDLDGNPSSIGAGTATLQAGGFLPTTLIYTGGTDTTDKSVFLEGSSLTIVLSNPGTLTWNGLFNGNGDLIVNGVSGTTMVFGDLMGAEMPLMSLTSNVLTTLNTASIDTIGSQLFTMPVTLEMDVALTIQGGGNHAFYFGQGIAGNKNLDLSSFTGHDTYTLLGSLVLESISIAASGGNDSLNINTGNQQNWTLTAGNSGSIVTAGVTNNIDFTNVENLYGSSGNDSFLLSGGTLDGTMDGNGGTNTLTADNLNNTWHVLTLDHGDVTGVNTFFRMQNMIGGNMNDYFVFSNNARVTGIIDGGGITGTNTLDYTAYSPRTNIHMPKIYNGYSYNYSYQLISTFFNINDLKANPVSYKSNTLLIPGTFGVVFAGPGRGYLNNRVSFSGFNLADPSYPVYPIEQQANIITANYVNPIDEWIDFNGTIQIDLESMLKQQLEDSRLFDIKWLCPGGIDGSCSISYIKLGAH